MKLFATTLLALASSASAFTNYDVCSMKKSGNSIIGAIDMFCRKTDITTPSPYTDNGFLMGSVSLHIYGNRCYPAQWVPEEWCRKNFFEMCANGDDEGKADAHYGHDQCQHWNINVIHEANPWRPPAKKDTADDTPPTPTTARKTTTKLTPEATRPCILGGRAGCL